jgi:hypothetical protein
VWTVAGNSVGLLNGIGTNALFNSPAGVCVNNVGSAPSVLYVTDTNNHAIRAIVLATGNTTTLAGSAEGWADGVGAAARFNQPNMCAVDSGNANMYVTDTGNGAIRAINLATRSVTTIIGKGCTSSAASCSDSREGCCLQGLASSPCSDASCYLPGNSGTAASFFQAQSLVLSYASPCSPSSGCLWVTSQLGTLSVVDLSSSPPAMTMAACVDPGGSSCTGCTFSGCTDYPFMQVQGVALDGASPPNILVALRSGPSGPNSGFAVWQCTSTGSLSTLASCSRDVGQGVGFQYVDGVDGAGDTSSTGTLGSWRDESSSSPLSAGLISPWGLAFDASATPPALFIADQNVIRRTNFVSGQPGDVVTVAGGASKALPGYGSDNKPSHWFSPAPVNPLVPVKGTANGVGTATAFNAPSNIVAVPATRVLYIADTSNDRIRGMTYQLN